MPWRGPQETGEFPTLGWIAIEWIESLNLLVPAGHPDKINKPLVLTDSQVLYFLHWYRLREDGRRYYRRGQDVGPKGCGKSPEGALTCLVEFDGPCVFAGWDSNGLPVATTRDDSVVSIVGLSETQTGNMYDWLYTALAHTSAADEHGWTVELGRISKQRGGFKVIESATSSLSTTGRARSFVAKEETWLWTASSGMTRVSRQLNADVAKVGGTTCEYTNPPEIGLGTVAELTSLAAAKGRQPIMIHRRGLTRDELPEAIRSEGIKKEINEPAVRECIRLAYADAMHSNGGWVVEDDIYEWIVDEETTEGEGYRLGLGSERQGAGRLVNPLRWDELEATAEVCAEIGAPYPRTIPPGSMVTLSFDGSMVIDSTALVMTSVETVPHQVMLKLWKRPPGAAGEGWKVPKHEVTELVHDNRKSVV